MARLCQRCVAVRENWQISQAVFTVGRINWTLNICDDCALTIEKAIIAVIGVPSSPQEQP